MTRVLVTGASGFIGGVALRALQAANYDVRGAVRVPMQIGAPTVVVGDIGEPVEWGAALKGIDVIIHLAGRAHVLRETAEDPLAEFRRVNTEGTRRLAEAAAHAGVKRFIYVSSIGVNGEASTVDGFTETDPPSPQKPYAVSKWEAEQALKTIALHRNIAWVIVRPPLVYGPDVGGNFLTLLKLVRRGLPLPLATTRNQRTLISVTNLADFLVRCVEHPAAADQTFVVGDDVSYSTADIIRLLARGMRRPALLLPFPPGLAQWGARIVNRESLYQQLFGTLVVDATKARERLGWTPPIKAEDGLIEAGRWFATLPRA